jgi:hypothetical protein
VVERQVLSFVETMLDPESEPVQEVSCHWDDIASVIEATDEGFQVTKRDFPRLEQLRDICGPSHKLVPWKFYEKEVSVELPSQHHLCFGGGSFCNHFLGLYKASAWDGFGGPSVGAGSDVDRKRNRVRLPTAIVGRVHEGPD